MFKRIVDTSGLIKPVLAVMLAICIVQPLHADNWDLDSLADELGQVTEIDVRFTEQRTSFLFSRPLVLEGNLHYRSPDFIEKVVDKPFEETVTIGRDRIIVDKGVAPGKADVERSQVYDADIHPAVRKAVDGLFATLGGDATHFKSEYDVTLTGPRDGWTLELVPLDEEFKKYLERIEVQGTGGMIASILTIDDDGDESLIEFDDYPVPGVNSEG